MGRAMEVFAQNNGEVTKAYYAELDAIGPMGKVCTALLRAQKRSDAAKRYRARKHTESAYGVKNWSINELTRLMLEHASLLGIRWGWKKDRNTPGYEWVIYVDTPNGQVSFHSPYRGSGPQYEGRWDGIRGIGRYRITDLCDHVLDGTPLPEKKETQPCWSQA